MRQIKLTLFKRFLLFFLMLFVDMSYHTKLFAYVFTGHNMSNCGITAGQACSGYSSGVYVTLLSQLNIMVLSENKTLYGLISSGSAGVSGYRSICICFTQAELSKLQSCASSSYGSCGMGATGTAMHVLYEGQDATGNEHISCGRYKGGCICTSGYYAVVNGCVMCSSGYYCSSNTHVYYDQAGGGSKACSLGYYQPNTGQISCYRCPSASSVSGTAYGVTANTGATSVTDCYIASTQNLQDAFGFFNFSKNCSAQAS